MRNPVILCTAIAFVNVCPSPATATEPRVFVLDGRHLERTREQIRQRPADFEDVLEVIRSKADEALEGGPWTVLDKPLIPPSGDKHDYYSVGPYWWPDPDEPDGLPYIRRDGEVNPDRRKYDNAGMSRMRGAVLSLAYGWYFVGEAAYAERAAALLRSWFLLPATRMNPHLEYGQAIPGRVEGRGIGIIDTVGLMDLVDAVGLLESAAAWSSADQQQLQEWFREYAHWLQTSEHGQDEANTSNNHAVFYDAQVAAFCLFAGDEPRAREVLEQVGPRRIATQIEVDGTMPHELARTKSFSYTLYNLRGFLYLARLGEHVGVDLWTFRTGDGRSLERALDWLAPFVLEKKEWTHEQITRFEPAKAALLYLRAGPNLDKPEYAQIGAMVDDPVSMLMWSDRQGDR